MLSTETLHPDSTPTQNCKRRKMNTSSSMYFDSKDKLTAANTNKLVNNNGAIIDLTHGTMTPLASENKENTEQSMTDAMEVVQTECPCGFLHGPGQGDHHDIHAVGLSGVPLLRGPD